jgi:cytochrome c
MSRFPKAVLGALLFALAGLALARASAKFQGLGRPASASEVAAWDIDVRPDFKGLPAGSGSVAKGQDVWEAKCAQCHGIFGESGEVFNPIVGGTDKNDIRTGHVARLNDPSYPGRTSFMKLATVSTLWDYINRAMPWTAPKSLSTEEVYAVTAYLLNLGGIVEDNFVLSDKSIREVQNRMPNRFGMQTEHALWPGKELGRRQKPDTQNITCMRNCSPEPKLASILPEFARNAHGNLAQQNRAVGAQHGIDTTQPEGKTSALTQNKTTDVGQSAKDNSGSKIALSLLQKNSCTACHALDKKVVGPSFQDIAKKHSGKVDYLATKIKSGGSGVWGTIPMPPQSLSTAEAKTLATWISEAAGK